MYSRESIALLSSKSKVDQPLQRKTAVMPLENKVRSRLANCLLDGKTALSRAHRVENLLSAGL